MTSDRAQLRRDCLEHLDKVARPHPAGHHNKPGRYILDTPDGPVALMVERNEEAQVNLWLPAWRAQALSIDPDRLVDYPASALWKKTNAKGQKLYGRHSGLRAMAELAEADLKRITLRSLGELRTILSDLMAVGAG